MTSLTSASSTAAPGETDRATDAAPVARPGGLAGSWQVARWELRKLVAQRHVVLLVWTCALAPVALVVVLRLQASTPADTLFGRWVQTTGYAVPLVVLGFAGQWAFPVLASVVAGDMFAGEDRNATWKSVLSRSRRRAEVFVGKSVVALVFAVFVCVLLVASSMAAGLLLVGDDPIIDLSGRLVPTGEALTLVLLSGLTQVAPVLAMASLSLMLSVLTRSTVFAVCGPVVLGLGLQLVTLVDIPPLVRALLPSGALASWRGLWLEDRWTAPIWTGLVSSLGLCAVLLGVAATVFLRRDVAVR